MCKVKHGREIYEKAAELLEYNPTKGEFRWKRSNGRRAIQGGLAGSRSTHGHRQIKIKGYLLIASRIAWFIETGEVPCIIDHINGDSSDDRILNLRNCTQSQNSRNLKLSSLNSSGVTGVVKRPNGKWRARITLNRSRIELGTFTNLEDAKQARIEAEKKYFGEFAPQRLTEA